MIHSCDKKCGQGKYSGPIYVCPHYNLKVLYPKLCEEWDPENTTTPDTYSPGSGIKVNWICKDNPCGCHKWPSIIKARVNGRGCPFCSNKRPCPHNNLLIKYPDLCKEWDPLNTKLPNEFLSGSDYEAKWICKDNPCGCHIWQATISSRIVGRGCPFCSNKRPCPHNNLLIKYPDLCKEWDPLNTKLPNEFLSGSDYEAKWICKDNPCGCHKWVAKIQSRTRKPDKNGKATATNCPYCSNQKLCIHNNLLAQFPKLCSEWDYKKNTKLPSDFAPYSHEKVWWNCPINKTHNYQSIIRDKTSHDQNCPYCSSHKIDESINGNNLLAKYPKLCDEWDYENNNKEPQTYAAHSHEKVWWKCKQGHSWESVIHSRTRDKCPTGCPQCSNSKGYSSMQILWLTNLAKKYDIQIQHAESIEGERNISTPTKSYKVDGYCTIKDKLIVFEFDGCFWHGCNVCYEDQTFVNTRCKKSMQELRSKTQHKHQAIRDAEYTLIIMKECDYNSSQVFCKELEDILY